VAFLFSACSSALYNAGIGIERWYAGMIEKSMDLNELKLSYLDGGSGEIILVIHGFGANKDSWNRFARHLTDKFRVIAVDLPGHGDSTSSLERKYDIQSQTLWLALFVDKLGMDRFHKPVFVIWGKQDRVLDVSSVSVFEERIPNTYSVILEDIGHAPMMEEPEASAGHYLHFLETL
jgi:pimeloyl-ACP methyl ester carboxylesterase